MQRRAILRVNYSTALLFVLIYACGDTSPSEPSPRTNVDAGSFARVDGGAAPFDGGEARIADALLNQRHTRHLGVGERPIPFEWPAEVVGEVEVVEAPVGSFRTDDAPIAPGIRLAPDALVAALYVEDTREPGSAGSLRMTYATHGGVTVEMTVAVDLDVHPCDTLAASPLDPDRYAEGWYLIDGPGAGQPNILDPAAAFPECERALAEYPDVPRFMLQLGRCHWFIEEYREAFVLAEQAMNLGSPWGYAATGAAYRDGHGVPVDYQRALELFRIGAEMGAPDAQNDLGKMLRDGLGVERDEAEALMWIRRAADYGFHWAQLDVGKLYRRGMDTPQDLNLARHWFELAAEQNNGHAMHELGLLYLGGLGVPMDAPRAEQYFLQAAEFELHWNFAALGYLYRDGAPGVPADREKAIEYFQRAVAAGNVEAQRALDELT